MTPAIYVQIKFIINWPTMKDSREEVIVINIPLSFFLFLFPLKQVEDTESEEV